MKNKNTGMPRVRPSRRVATRHRVPLAHTRAIPPPPAPRPAHFDASRRHERDLSHDGFSRARARDDVFAEVHARRSVRVNRFDRTRDGWDGDGRPMRECTTPPRERTRERCARVARSRDDGWDGRARGGEAFGRIGDARVCIFCLSFPSIARVVEAGDACGRGRETRDRARGVGRGGKALSIHPRRRASVFVGVRSGRGGWGNARVRAVMRGDG